MPRVIPASPGNNIVISIDYAADDATRWARLFDNPALGWIVDDGGAAPAQPVVIGALPPVAASDPVLSPQWATFNDPTVFVPDLWRGTLADFLTWLATNNGAQRVLQARFGLHSGLANGFDAWARVNPTRVFEGDPPEAPAGEQARRGAATGEEEARRGAEAGESEGHRGGPSRARRE